MAIILRGGSFRLGSERNRDVGSDRSYEEQKAACETHNKLADKIESLGYNVDIYIDTYTTKYDNELLSWYGERVKGSKFHKEHLPSQEALIKDSIDLLEDSIDYYEVLLILRLDLFLKDQYIDEYNPDVDKIQYISACCFSTKTPKGNPKINDVIFHFPKKYYTELYILYNGDSTKNGMRPHDMLDDSNIAYDVDYTFLTKTYYDADSQKDLNPYYRMTNRPENTVSRDLGREFPRDF